MRNTLWGLQVVFVTVAISQASIAQLPITIAEEAGDPTFCVSSETVACLRDGRFAVSVVWEDFQGNVGLPSYSANLAPLGIDDSATFRWLPSGPLELLLAINNACVPDFGNRFWVFLAPKTNVGFAVRVTDSWTGDSKIYTNELGNFPIALGDTDAFATCDVESPLFNEPPVVANEQWPLDGSSFGDRPVDGNVLENDSDPDGGPLPLAVCSWEFHDGPTELVKSWFNLLPNGEWTFTPADDYCRLFNVAYSVCDGVDESTGRLSVLASSPIGFECKPTPTFGEILPSNGSSFSSGAEVCFSATASDPEDGDVSNTLAWQSSLDGELGIGPSLCSALSDGVHVVTVRAGDRYSDWVVGQEFQVLVGQ